MGKIATAILKIDKWCIYKYKLTLTNSSFIALWKAESTPKHTVHESKIIHHLRLKYSTTTYHRSWKSIGK